MDYNHLLDHVSFLPILDRPEFSALGNARRREKLEAARVELLDSNRATFQDGAAYWSCNGNPVPLGFFRDHFVTLPANQEAAVKAHNDLFLAEYFAFRSAAGVSEEERSQARAAHGPGGVIVDVVTGHRFTT